MTASTMAITSAQCTDPYLPASTAVLSYSCWSPFQWITIPTPQSTHRTVTHSSQLRHTISSHLLLLVGLHSQDEPQFIIT